MCFTVCRGKVVVSHQKSLLRISGSQTLVGDEAITPKNPTEECHWCDGEAHGRNLSTLRFTNSESSWFLRSADERVHYGSGARMYRRRQSSAQIGRWFAPMVSERPHNP